MNTDDLAVARALAAGGVPIFLAVPDAAESTGYKLPIGWQHLAADPSVVDGWAPGMALGAVMGAGLDLIDIDPRNGGDVAALGQRLPNVHGIATTPSGGMHLFVASLGVGSRDGVLPGIDLKGGMPDGSSRGFAFIAPTVRVSKVTGLPEPYRWTQPAVVPNGVPDASGADLAALVRELRAATGGARPAGGPDWWQAFLRSREPQSAAAAERAIAGKLAEVASWSDGQGTGFRTVLMRAALTLGGYVGSGYLDETEASVRLATACGSVWGSPDADDERWIRQGLADGAERPFPVLSLADAELANAPAGAVPFSIYAAIGAEPFDPPGLNDQDMAEAVLARMRPVLRYANDAGAWLTRNAERWETGEDARTWAVAQVVPLMPLGDPSKPARGMAPTADQVRGMRRARFQSTPGTSGVVAKMAALVARHAVHPSCVRLDALDAEREILWAGGYPYDLRRSAERPALAELDPGTPHLHCAAVAPAAVPTPGWDAFTAAVWPDEAVRTWVLRVLSIALTGYSDAALPLLVGQTRRGKTQAVALLSSVLGSYAHTADSRLLNGADNTHASVIYALRGRRLSFIDEGPRSGHWAQEALKQLTGGAMLTGNAMRQNPVTFSPTHTLILTANDEPSLGDPAIRARVRFIPCEGDPAEIRTARRALGHINGPEWQKEAPGILAAMMSEAAGWLADPDSALTENGPAGIQFLAENAAAKQDYIKVWVDEETMPYPPGTKGSELFASFVTWARSVNVHPSRIPSLTRFGLTLNDLGLETIRRADANYRPLRVTTGYRGGALPSAPSPQAFMEGAPDTSRRVGGVPPIEHLPSVTDVSSSIMDSMEGSSSTTTKTKENTHTHTLKHEYSPIIGFRSPASSSPARQIEQMPSSEAVPSADGDRPGDPPSDPSTVDSAQTPSVTAVSARKRQPKLTKPGSGTSTVDKAAERAARAAAKITERITAASGAELALPASVDRAGTVTVLELPAAGAAVLAGIERSGGALTVDVETTGYPVGHANYQLRTIQLGDSECAIVFDATDAEHVAYVRALVNHAPILHAHSATADLVPLAHAGIVDIDSAWERMLDTVISAKLADPASTGSDPGLKQLAGAMLGENATTTSAEAARSELFKAGRWLKDIEADTPAERSGWAQVSARCETMIRYAASDVLDTAALARVLPLPAPAVLARERSAQRITARVAHVGLALDAAQVARLTAEHEPALAAAAARLAAAGIANPGSDAQVGAALAQRGATLPLTPTGRPSVAKGALEPLRGSQGALGALVTDVLGYRHHETALSTFLRPYASLCAHGDGRARPTIYTLGADTGRMSAVRPNLQQVPRAGGFRACITADPGQLRISADFAGVELRGAAALSQDAYLMSMLASGVDIHGEIARQVFGAGASKADRYKVKPTVFGHLYGGGIPTLARQLGEPEYVVASIVDTLRAMMPGVAAWSDEMRQAIRNGMSQFETYSGRIIHLDPRYPHKGPNYAIQGTARELLVDALLKWADTQWGNCVVLPIHDEVLAMVPEDEADAALKTLVECMTTTLYGVDIIAEASAPSFAWADSE